MAATEREQTPPAQERSSLAIPGGNISRLERWLSVLAGGALLGYGLRQRGAGGIGAALLGGALAGRGLSARCLIYRALGINTADRSRQPGFHVQRKQTVNRPVEEVYGFWRSLDHLPEFMNHLESVTVHDEKRSRWVAKAPLGATVAWEAEIIDDVPKQRIAWRALPGAEIQNSGYVTFKPIDENCTEICVSLEYAPPAGLLGVMVARMFGEEPQQQINEDLRRFKQLLETGDTSGELPADDDAREPATTLEGTERRMKYAAKVHKEQSLEDAVEVASDQSFPASDPPGWTSRRSFT